MSTRIASDRVIPFSTAHLSTAARNSSGSLTAVTGSRPVAGRPRPRFFFGMTFIDFIEIRYYIITIKRGLQYGKMTFDISLLSASTGRHPKGVLLRLWLLPHVVRDERRPFPPV